MLSRRSFLAAVTAASAGMLLGACAPHPSDLPNVLILQVNGLNDRISLFRGRAGIATPNIDALAARGTWLANAHAAAARSLPARASVWTGLAPTTSGIYANSADFRRELPRAVTLAQFHLQLEMDTLGAGLLLMPDDLYSWQQFRPSAGRSTLPLSQAASLPGYEAPQWGPIEIKEETMRDSAAAQWLAEKIRTAPPSRRALWAMGFTSATLPWVYPRGYTEWQPIPERPPPQGEIVNRLPPMAVRTLDSIFHYHVQIAGVGEDLIASYAYCVHFVDRLVGILLNALDDSGRLDDTAILLFSPLGLHLGEKMHWFSGTLWEPTTHVPLILCLPGAGDAGQRIDHPVSLLDVYPTLAEYYGVRLPWTVDGVSLLPLLRGESLPRDGVISSRTPHTHAVRTARWRYIRYPDGSEELYDHDSDPGETINLGENPEWAAVRADLARHLPPLPDAGESHAAQS